MQFGDRLAAVIGANTFADVVRIEYTQLITRVVTQASYLLDEEGYPVLTESAEHDADGNRQIDSTQAVKLLGFEIEAIGTLGELPADAFQQHAQ